jgi:hypothetical protein
VVDDHCVSRHGVGGDAVSRPSRWSVFFQFLPPEGIDLALTIQRPGKPEITVMDQSDGLPQPEELSIKPRPSDLMPGAMAAVRLHTRGEPNRCRSSLSSTVTATYTGLETGQSTVRDRRTDPDHSKNFLLAHRFCSCYKQDRWPVPFE